MPDDIPSPADVSAACAWPGCDRAPDVMVDYEQTKSRDLRLAWLPQWGGVNLCDRHAVELALRDVAGARVLGVTRLE
jgi:hypothetical protein